MTEPEPTPSQKYDISIGDMTKLLINAIIKDSENSYGDTPMEKIRYQLRHGTGNDTLGGITALSSYMAARAAERQATAMESLAKTASKLQVADALDTSGQAIVDDRESKRDYLATTYSLPTELLSFLWAIRGMLIDGSLKSLSKPAQFEPYRRVTTEEIAWTLRMTEQQFYDRLPRTPQGEIDYSILQEFDILHYGGTDERPDNWMYGG